VETFFIGSLDESDEEIMEAYGRCHSGGTGRVFLRASSSNG